MTVSASGSTSRLVGLAATREQAAARRTENLMSCIVKRVRERAVVQRIVGEARGDELAQRFEAGFIRENGMAECIFTGVNERFVGVRQR